MRLLYAVPEDIDAWMGLVSRVRLNFPGLDTEEGMADYRSTVLRFMKKRQAICVKADGEIMTSKPPDTILSSSAFNSSGTDFFSSLFSMVTLP